MACPGFILAGAEKNIWGAKKNSGGAESRPKGTNFFSAPPPEFDSAPGAELARGGGGRKRKRKEHLIIKNRGRDPKHFGPFWDHI